MSANPPLHNRESSALQYAMRDHLIALGWSEIETVDDDLGRSVAGCVARAGFERMAAESCVGKVGPVTAREVSRFAYNSHDWQQLIDVPCRRHGVDQPGDILPARRQRSLYGREHARSGRFGPRHLVDARRCGLRTARPQNVDVDVMQKRRQIAPLVPDDGFS
jgi:hypothetical protein